jgi:hypothetical protein
LKPSTAAQKPAAPSARTRAGRAGRIAETSQYAMAP